MQWFWFGGGGQSLLLEPIVKKYQKLDVQQDHKTTSQSPNFTTETLERFKVEEHERSLEIDGRRDVKNDGENGTWMKIVHTFYLLPTKLIHIPNNNNEKIQT